ncbi:hypothetical protein B4U80_14146 [Leptotrombidium deliense]|uniref:C-type lectin domain-containing protein n=1 Tax=Leptotrombidium deliense TaxID=299467 RepID=A0A443S1Q7_9ACAR|nr:hypothetical protein B4U80_14146 [Leptotrombidium deliense]
MIIIVAPDCNEITLQDKHNLPLWFKHCILERVDVNSIQILSTITSAHLKAKRDDETSNVPSIPNENKKYKFFVDKKTFKEAKEFCLHTNGKLLEIRDANENKFISEKLLFGQSYWIGAIRLMTYSSIFLHSSGKYMSFVNWDATEPKPTESDNCVKFENAKMYTDNCEKQFMFICEYPERKAVSNVNTVIESLISENRKLQNDFDSMTLLISTILQKLFNIN